MEGSHLGLGYFQQTVASAEQLQDVGSNTQHHSLQHQQQSQAEGVGVGSGTIDDYMNQYLQQCLQYHEEQEAIRKFSGHQQPQQQLATQFVAGGIIHEVEQTTQHQADTHLDQQQEEPLVNNDASRSDGTHATNESSMINPENNALVEEGRNRAQEILKRFQQHQEQLLYAPTNPLPAVEGTRQTSLQQHQLPEQHQKVPAYHISEEPPEPSLFLEQRRRGMQRELQNKKHALLKNFEYVAEKEQQRSSMLHDQIAHARNLEQHAKLQYEAATLRRKQQQTEGALQTQAGIGTKKRKKVERIKEKTGHVPLPNGNNQDNNTVAVYISGLPTNGSVTRELINNLFGSFGNIEKIHFYRDKKTGDLKGDGLVIYNLEKGADCSNNQSNAHELVEMVCSQMNGAELSQGVRLSVEPSSSNKKESRLAKSGVKMAGEQPTQHMVDSLATETSKTETKDDVELDDFFNSL